MTTTPVRVFGTRIGAGPSFVGKAYVYNGDIPLAKDPEILGTEASRKMPQRGRRAECGSMLAYNQHLREGSETCQPCRDAAAENQRLVRIRRMSGKARSFREFAPDKCGTNAGYSRHRYYRLEACEPCKVAHRIYLVERKEAR